MAQDMQWPSEDEDFDAVAGAAPADDNQDKTATSPRRVQPVAADSQPAKSVSVTADEEPEEEPDVDPVEAAFVEEEEEAEPEAEAPQQAETKSEPAPAPVVTKQTPVQDTAPSSGHNAFRTVMEAILIIALLGLGYFAYTLYNDKQALQSEVTVLNANPQLAVQRQTDKLIRDVAKLMTLPKGETPTVANVSDATKAKQQSTFFANAQNGDKVLMYVKAGQAILYRPDTNKIVLVAPLTFNNSTAATNNSAAATPPAKSVR